MPPLQGPFFLFPVNCMKRRDSVAICRFSAKKVPAPRQTQQLRRTAAQFQKYAIWIIKVVKAVYLSYVDIGRQM